MELWYETHSTSVDNEQGIASGHLDTPLSGLGRQQAAELGIRYAGRGLKAVYTSDLQRAVDTARIAFGQTAIPRIQDPRLRECDYGIMSGCAMQQINAVRSDHIEKRFPDGQSITDVVRRMRNFLNELDGTEGPVLLIAHRAPWYALEHLLNGRNLHQIVTSPWQWQPGWLYNLKPLETHE